MDIEAFRKNSKDLIDFVCEYRKTLDSKKLHDRELGLLKANVPTSAPEAPVKWETVMENYERYFMKGLTNPQHRQSFSNSPMGASYPSMMADMLTDGIGGVPLDEMSDTPYKELAILMTDWLCKALDLPEAFLNSNVGAGYLQISQVHCAMNCLFTARNHTFKKHKLSLNNGDCAKLIAYCTVETHYLIKKAVHLALLTIHILPSNADNTVNIENFEKAMKADLDDGYIPVFLAVNLGTLAGGIDHLEKLGEMCKANDIWFHVDAERFGFSLICPEMRVHAKGIECADSFSISVDIWGLVHPYCSCLYVKDKKKMVSALKTKLDSKEDNSCAWMMNVQPYKALNIWFVLQTYGISGIREYQRNHIKLAKYLESILKRDDDFEVVNNVMYNVVCFTLKDQTDAVNKNLFKTLNDSGDIRVSTNKIGDKNVIVFNVNSENEDENDINKAFDTIRSAADKVKNQCTCIRIEPRADDGGD